MARNFPAIARRYAESIVSGTVVAGKLARLAAARFLRDLEAAKSRTCLFRFDKDEAANVCDFIEKLPHVEGRWRSATLTLEPWQVFILVNVFGFRNRATGHRRFDTAYIEVARKNAKSTLTAGVSLYCLTCEDEVGPQIKCAASTGSQARIVFDVAKKMVDATPALREAFDLSSFADTVNCGQNAGHIRPINSKSSSQDGLNPHLSVIDELHAHKDRSLFDVLRSARGARQNPLSWYITTAGYNSAGVCYEQRDYVAKILSGAVDDDSYFGIVYTIDDTDDVFDEAVWPKANPNLGVSVNPAEMRSYAAQARNSPASLGEFRTKRLNFWTNAADAWLNMTAWSLCADSTLCLEDFEGEPAWIGVDLADTGDVAALALLFERDGAVYAFAKFYLPELLVDRLAHKITTHYRVWADEGMITLTSGDFIDHRAIEADIRCLAERFEVRRIAIEHYGSAAIAASMNEDSLPVVIVAKNPKTYSDAAKDIEARVDTQRLRHNGNKMLTWMASNTVVSRRVDGSILPKKESEKSFKKIDGIDALIMANAQRMADAVEDLGPSVYETERDGEYLFI